MDSCSVDGLYADEAERALDQFASWLLGVFALSVACVVLLRT